MANNLVSWLSLGVSALMAVACFMLYIDGRGHKKTTGALQRKVKAQDELLGNLARALALVVPQDARPTVPHRPMPQQQEAAARTAYAEIPAGGSLGPPPEMEGDRGGIIPGDPIPSERVEYIRARFEAEAEARSQARAVLPSAAGEDEPEEEHTRVYEGRGRRRPTLLGGLAGAPQERPRSEPAREESTSRTSDTLFSAGVALPDEGDDGYVIVEVHRHDGTPLSDRPSQH
jgi:hypothetical protein